MGPRVVSQHKQGSPQPSVSPVPENLTLLLAFSGTNWEPNIHANKITKSIKIETHKITQSLKIERKYSGVRSFLASIPPYSFV